MVRAKVSTATDLLRLNIFRCEEFFLYQPAIAKLGLKSLQE
ncbi:hypothetical protein [Prevotella melaninogenica]|nr:hypothetical protein [Prevotella melaninogenica]